MKCVAVTVADLIFSWEEDFFYAKHTLWKQIAHLDTVMSTYLCRQKAQTVACTFGVKGRS